MSLFRPDPFYERATPYNPVKYSGATPFWSIAILQTYEIRAIRHGVWRLPDLARTYREHLEDRVYERPSRAPLALYCHRGIARSPGLRMVFGKSVAAEDVTWWCLRPLPRIAPIRRSALRSILHRDHQVLHDVVLSLRRVLAHVKRQDAGSFGLRRVLDFAHAHFFADELRELLRADFA